MQPEFAKMFYCFYIDGFTLMVEQGRIWIIFVFFCFFYFTLTSHFIVGMQNF